MFQGSQRRFRWSKVLSESFRWSLRHFRNPGSFTEVSEVLQGFPEGSMGSQWRFRDSQGRSRWPQWHFTGVQKGSSGLRASTVLRNLDVLWAFQESPEISVILLKYY